MIDLIDVQLWVHSIVNAGIDLSKRGQRDIRGETRIRHMCSTEHVHIHGMFPRGRKQNDASAENCNANSYILTSSGLETIGNNLEPYVDFTADSLDSFCM